METQARAILVVDGAMDTDVSYGQALGQLGFAVEICGQGARASLELARRSFDLVLLDPCLPGVDALQLLMQANQQPAPPAIVVVGEGMADGAERDDAPPAGRGLLLKPFSPDQLRRAVDLALRERRAASAQSPASGIDLPRLYEQIAVVVLALCQADRVSLTRWSDGGERLTVAASAGAPFTTPGDTSAPLHDSVSSWVLRHTVPLRLGPDSEPPIDLQGAWRSKTFRSSLGAPLIVRGRALGVLVASRGQGRAPFAAHELDLLSEVAGRAALVVESALRQSQAERRAYAQARLNELGAALMATLDSAEALQITAAQLSLALPAACGYLVYQGAGPWFDGVLPLGGLRAEPPSPNELREAPGLARRVLADGIARRIDIAALSHELAPWERRLAAAEDQTLLCVALKTDRGVYGAIELVGRQGLLGDEELQFVSAAAGLAALALEHAQTHALAARYEMLFQHAGDAIFLIDSATAAIVAANPAAEQMSGYSLAELSLLAPSRLIAPGPPGRPAAIADVLSGELAELEGFLRTRAGYSVPVSIGVNTLVLGSERHLLITMRSTSEQQQQAQRLAQSEKLAGMARLTASIAHEINNPLQALHNTLHLLVNRSFSEEKREQLLHMAQLEVDRLTTIVRRMLELHRPAHEDMRPVSIHGLLESALAGAAPQLQQHQVSIERDWAEQLPWVLGIGGHLKQVFRDLAANAADAMPNGGRLMIRTRLEEAANDGAPPRVLVEFSDNGPGLSASEATLVFEPFYSTKRTNTGLGLAISYSIVERHGGTISVSSSSGGTTFRVLLPAALLAAQR